MLIWFYIMVNIKFWIWTLWTLRKVIYIQRIYIYISCENYHTFWPVRVLSIFQTLLKSEIVNKLISYEGIIDLIGKTYLFWYYLDHKDF